MISTFLFGLQSLNGEVELLNDDDGDDEWIMFQLCGDAKSQEVDLLQSAIIRWFR